MKNFSVSVSFNFDPQVKLDIAETDDLETLLQYRLKPRFDVEILDTHLLLGCDGRKRLERLVTNPSPSLTFVHTNFLKFLWTVEFDQTPYPP